MESELPAAGDRLARLPLLVDAHEFAESDPVVLRHRLNAPLILRGVLALGALRRTERRVGDLALQGVVGVPDLQQLAADLGEAQRRVAVLDRHERQGEGALDDQGDQADEDRALDPLVHVRVVRRGAGWEIVGLVRRSIRVWSSQSVS